MRECLPLPSWRPVEETGVDRGVVLGGHIGDVWAAVHAALALPVFESDN